MPRDRVILPAGFAVVHRAVTRVYGAGCKLFDLWINAFAYD